MVDHLIQLSAKVQIALSTCQILQETWDNTFATILKVHQDFLSHFSVTLSLALLTKRGRDIGSKKKWGRDTT